MIKRMYPSTKLLVVDHSTVSAMDAPSNTSEKKIVMQEYTMSCVCVCYNIELR